MLYIVRNDASNVIFQKDTGASLPSVFFQHLHASFMSISRLFIIALVIWATGFLGYVSMIPEKRTNDKRITDGIVVLTGGKYRISEGVRLIRNKRSPRMLVSGIGGKTNISALLISAGVSPQETQRLQSMIDIDYQSRSTSDNADQTTDWVKKHNIKTLRVVTSNYHMPRALREMRQHLPEADIIPHPVFSESFHVERWYAHRNSIGLLMSEYHKFLAAILIHFYQKSSYFLLSYYTKVTSIASF